MKNRNKLIILITIAAIGFQSCNSFLELEPVSNSIAVNNNDSSAPAFNTASEVEAALAGVYREFKNEYYQLDYFVNGDAQSDDAYAGGDNPSNFQIDDFTLDATNTNVSRDWAYLYSMIGISNAIINNTMEITDPELTEARKTEIVGEASFIRAFNYFQLTQLWGDVPLLLDEVNSISAEILDDIFPILFPPRSPQSDVYDQIIIDLETARTSVNDNVIHKGYATTGAANALLAKVYATRVPQDWNKVESYCEAVINGPYSLMPEFDDLWNNENENCAESIYEINYSGGSNDGNWGVTIFRGLDWKKFNLPSNDLIKAFDDEGDIIRKEASIIFEDVTGSWSDVHYPQTEYPFINKYRIFTGERDQNYIFIRLADIILLKAEALNEQNDVQGAADLVNQIRTRVQLADTPANDYASMKLAIEKERRLELAYEGIRWFDLKRTGRAIEVMNQVIGADLLPIGYQLNSDKLLWPIPQSELDKNSKLEQNPGY